MITQTTSWRIPPWAYAPLGAAIVAEAVSNALRAYGLGQHLEHFTVSIRSADISLAGSVLVLAAVAVSLSQARAAWVALTPHPLRQRIVAGVAAALLLAVSVSAMASHILEAQRAKEGAEAGASTDYKNAKALYDGIAGQVEALKRFGVTKDALPRPREAIDAEINRINTKLDWAIWVRSKKCTDITKPESNKECAPVLALYEEQGAFASLVQLQPSLIDAKAKLEALRKPVEAATTAEETVSGYWAWIMGLAVVFVATFGSVIFAEATPVSHPAAAAAASELVGEGTSERSQAPPSGLNIDCADASPEASEVCEQRQSWLQPREKFPEPRILN
jgi:hypothetical protein